MWYVKLITMMALLPLAALFLALASYPAPAICCIGMMFVIDEYLL